LTGARPFAGKSWQEIIISLSRDAHPDVRARATEASEDLAAVVDRCLEKTASNRYATARELVDALACCGPAAANTATTARNARPLAPVAKSRRSSVPFLVAGVVAIAAMAFTAKHLNQPFRGSGF